jgi:hypothetical protein
MKTLTQPQKWGMLFACTSITTELLAQVFMQVYRNTIYVYEFYDIATVALVSIFYIKFIEAKYRRAISLFVVGYILLKITEWAFFDGFTKWTFSTTFFPRIFFILISLRYFYLTFRGLSERALTKTALFWIASAILFYNSSALFLFIFSKYIFILSEQGDFDLWIINAVLNILFNVLLTVAIWMKPPSPQRLTSRY